MSHVSVDTARAWVSGQVVKISGEVVVGKVSGEAVKISGETVIGKISGETIISKISGETVVGKVSGETIIGKISGETVVTAPYKPTTIRYGRTTVTISGVQLSSGQVVGVTIEALDVNSGKIYAGDSAVTTAIGFPLLPGAALHMDVDNLNRVYVCADVSSDKVAYLGVE